MYLIHKPGEAHEGVATRATRATTMGPTRTRVMKTTGAAEWEQANEQLYTFLLDGKNHVKLFIIHSYWLIGIT